MSPEPKPPIVSSALLITGAAVGAGILGMPIKTGLAGFWPSLLVQLALAGAMLATCWAIALRLIHHHGEGRDLPWLFERELGRVGRGLLVGGYLIMQYGILVAYLSGSASVLSALLVWPEGKQVLMLCFFVPATALALAGLNVVRWANLVLVVLLAASFLWLVWPAVGATELKRLAYTDWSYVPATFPVIMTGLSFHTMVPLTCRSLGMRRRAIGLAMVTGMAITSVLGILLTLLVSGVLPVSGGPGSLAAAFAADQPATVPLARHLGSATVLMAGLVFSLAAIGTSYLGMGSAMVNFWKDLLPPRLTKRWIRVIIAFGPPLVIVYVYPDLFLEALDLVGGLGVALAFGLGPSLMLMRRSGAPAWTRAVGLVLALFFIGMAALELTQEVGLLKISPHVENWTSYQKAHTP